MTKNNTNTSSGPVNTDRWLATGLIVLAFGAAAVALLGPLATELIRYHASDGAVNQIVGGDVAGLALVAPLSAIAGVLVARGHRAGRVLALGPAVYALYMYSQLALGGDMARYPGNSERFFPLFIGLFILSAAIAIRAWNTIDPDTVPAPSRTMESVLGWYALVVATFLAFGLHLPGLVDAWRDQPTSTEYLADPAVFWLVKMMDLGLVVPALTVVGVALIQNRTWLVKAGYATAGWMALLGSSIAGMAIVMQVTDDPAATATNTVAFTLFALVGLVIATVVHWPLMARQPTRRSVPAPPPAAARGAKLPGLEATGTSRTFSTVGRCPVLDGVAIHEL